MRGTQERKINFVKTFFPLYIKGSTQERKFNFVKNFLNSSISGSTQEIIKLHTIISSID